MPQLRPYQQQLKHDIYTAWQTYRNVLAVAPTGAGKTVVFSDIMNEYPGASLAVAHRQELVSQISLALARNGVRHRIIGADHLPRTCVQIHMAEVGRSYYDPNAMHAVAGVDTLVRMDPATPYFQQVGLGIGDEAHHFLRGNKWGKGVDLFPNARWLLVTATPTRADGKGLGRHADGIADTMVEAPNMRDLIDMGYLTDYRIFAPKSDLDLSDVPTAAGGDYSPEPLRKAVHKSHIVGDVVQHYLRHASGKLGITFAVDVESATDIAKAYRDAGVPAEVVSAKTPDMVRIELLRRFRARQIMQLVNVDLFGEGFDLPAIEVVSFARPTQSFALYAQQFGRALRLMIGDDYARCWDSYTDEQRRSVIAHSSKPRAIIIDHVGNCNRGWGLPDSKRIWTMDRRDRAIAGKRNEFPPLRICAACVSAYEAVMAACPYCGVRYVPALRGTPTQVDGDLAELSPEALAILRGQIDAPMRIPYDATPEIAGAIARRFGERMEERSALVEAMQRWGGKWIDVKGATLSEAQRRFFFKFGIDVATAQTLPRADAEALRLRVMEDLR